MADFEARLLVDYGWEARKYPPLDAMLNVARREDGSWAIAPETIILTVNVVTGRSLRVSNLVDFERLFDVLRLLNEYNQLALAAPYVPGWLCSLGRDDNNLLARSWRGVRVAWLTADPCRLPLCVEVMAHVCRAAADGELIDVEGMTYGSSPFALPPWLPRDISDLRTRNFNNVLWLTGKYIRDMSPSSKPFVTAGREIFKNRFAQLEQYLESAGKMASVEEVLDSIIRAHPLWTEHEALRSFIEPTNESTRISFIAAFSREEEDPSGTLLMTRFGQDIVDSIRKQRDMMHSPERYMARPLYYLGPKEAQVLSEAREARKRAGMLLPVSSEEDERHGRYAPWRGPGESFGA